MEEYLLGFLWLQCLLECRIIDLPLWHHQLEGDQPDHSEGFLFYQMHDLSTFQTQSSKVQTDCSQLKLEKYFCFFSWNMLSIDSEEIMDTESAAPYSQ